jgi:hypothetical protein
MEAIKAIAKRTKTGKYKIILPIESSKKEVNIIVVYNSQNKKVKK